MALLTIRFINGSGFVSDAIDWVTNSLWDHVEIMTESGTWIGAHASGGVQERPANYCTPTRERRYGLECTDEQFSSLMAKARSLIGTPYDFGDIVGIFLRIRSLHSKGREICSMFVTEMTDFVNIWMLNVEPDWDYLVTPEILHTSALLRGRCIFRFN